MMKKLKKIVLLSTVFIALISPAMAGDFPWTTFLSAIITGKAPAPEPTLTCANHKISLCSIWTENITGYEEVGRRILPDCTVKFYEFGDSYYTGTWEPISETTVLLHNWNRDIIGTYVNSNSYKEGNLRFSCGTRFAPL